MRELWARRVVIFTAILIVLLAVMFARVQNPDKTSDTTPAKITSTVKSVNPDVINKGMQIYQQQHCGGCHSIAGSGNPRSPLDGVGKKFSADELHDYITGADRLQGVLPDVIRRLKTKYRELPAAELEALVHYLQSLDT